MPQQRGVQAPTAPSPAVKNAEQHGFVPDSSWQEKYGFVPDPQEAFPATPPSPYAEIQKYLDQSAATGFAEAGIGAAKSVGRTLVGLPDLYRHYIGGLPSSSIETKGRILMEPTNPAQVLGGKMGEAGQYALPAVATGGMALPYQVLAGALGSAAVAEGAGEDPGTAALLGGAAPIAGVVGGKLVPTLRKGAEERVARVIGPVGQEKKELLRILPEITARKPFAWSSEGLLKKFAGQADRVAASLDVAIDAADTGRTINANALSRNIQPLIESLKIEGKFITPEAEKAALQLKGIQAEIKALGRIDAPYSQLKNAPTKRVVQNPYSPQAPFRFDVNVPAPIPEQTVGAGLKQLRSLRQQYDQIVAGAAEHFFRTLPPESRATAAKIGGRTLRDAIAQFSPETAAQSREYSKLATVRNILQNNEVRGVAGTHPGMGKIAELGGVAAGVATQSVAPVVGGGVLAGLIKFSQSTPFRLAASALQTSFANALQSGNLTQATNLMGQMTRSALMKPSPPPTGSPRTAKEYLDAKAKNAQSK